MTIPNHDDDAMHDPRFDAAWRAASREEPPPFLDAAIRAAARNAVGAGPQREVTSVPEATRPERWWWPLAAAATIGAIAIGMLQLVPREHDGTDATKVIVSDMPSEVAAGRRERRRRRAAARRRTMPARRRAASCRCLRPRPNRAVHCQLPHRRPPRPHRERAFRSRSPRSPPNPTLARRRPLRWPLLARSMRPGATRPRRPTWSRHRNRRPSRRSAQRWPPAASRRRHSPLRRRRTVLPRPRAKSTRPSARALAVPPHRLPWRRRQRPDVRPSPVLKGRSVTPILPSRRRQASERRFRSANGSRLFASWSPTAVGTTLRWN